MSDLVKEMRVAMDEVIHDEVNDLITDDSDTEMKQAIETAALGIRFFAGGNLFRRSANNNFAAVIAALRA